MYKLYINKQLVFSSISALEVYNLREMMLNSSWADQVSSNNF
jgi:hypothetical protein